jgi:quercetin dioxygenase-like cupin family protein
VTETGYATVTLTSGNRERHESHTSPLGCTATAVESYHLAPGAEVTLPCEPEQVCVPILPAADTEDGTASTTAWAVHLGSESLPRTGVGRVPAGVETTLGVSSNTSTRAERASETATGVTVLLIAAPADSGSASTPVVADVADSSFTEPDTSDIETARLTATLGCRGVKLNARRLRPGQRVPYHTEGDQEELFVPVRGPATMEIDGERIETPVGTVTRVAPPVPRSAVNGGERDATWVMIGAPPTGGPDEWDPGAEILE